MDTEIRISIERKTGQIKLKYVTCCDKLTEIYNDLTEIVKNNFLFSRLGVKTEAVSIYAPPYSKFFDPTLSLPLFDLNKSHIKRKEPPKLSYVNLYQFEDYKHWKLNGYVKNGLVFENNHVRTQIERLKSLLLKHISEEDLSKIFVPGFFNCDLVARKNFSQNLLSSKQELNDIISILVKVYRVILDDALEQCHENNNNDNNRIFPFIFSLIQNYAWDIDSDISNCIEILPQTKQDKEFVPLQNDNIYHKILLESLRNNKNDNNINIDDTNTLDDSKDTEKDTEKETIVEEYDQFYSHHEKILKMSNLKGYREIIKKFETENENLQKLFILAHTQLNNESNIFLSKFVKTFTEDEDCVNEIDQIQHEICNNYCIVIDNTECKPDMPYMIFDILKNQSWKYLNKHKIVDRIFVNEITLYQQYQNNWREILDLCANNKPEKLKLLRKAGFNTDLHSPQFHQPKPGVERRSYRKIVEFLCLKFLENLFQGQTVILLNVLFSYFDLRVKFS